MREEAQSGLSEERDDNQPGTDIFSILYTPRPNRMTVVVLPSSLSFFDANPPLSLSKGKMQLSTQLMPHGHFTQPLCSGYLCLMRNRGIISIPLPEPIHSGQSLHPHHKP